MLRTGRNATSQTKVLVVGVLTALAVLAVHYEVTTGSHASSASYFADVYSSPSTPAAVGPFVPFKLPDHVGTRKESDFLVTRVPELPAYVREWKTGTERDLFNRLYLVDEKQGRLFVPDTFSLKVKDMFKAYPGGSESLHFVEQQTLVTIRNKITHDHSLFNRIRRYRPGYREVLSDEENDALTKQIDDSRGDKCDFCHPERTASDIWGKIEGTHCYVASNVAKYEKWHSLLISKEHSPIKFSLEAMRDYLATANRWFQKVHETDRTAVAPHLMWDSTGRASASQIHQHLQMSINTHYYTKAEIFREQAGRYAQMHGRNLWADMADVHDHLGLAIRRGTAVLLVHLTPIKEREIMVIGNSNSVEFAELLYVAVRGLIDEAGSRSFSAGIVFEHQESPLMMPAVARVIDRGAPADVRNDAGAMEFYGSNNVGMVCFLLQTHSLWDLEVV